MKAAAVLMVLAGFSAIAAAFTQGMNLGVAGSVSANAFGLALIISGTALGLSASIARCRSKSHADH